jgi:diguanylate cyclase (GGDEF)-like protein
MESVKEISKSRIDPLSGLYSKGRVEDELRREVAAYNRKPEEKEMIVLFIDGDEFKHYNDVYGHAVGDEIIKQMGRAIGASIRENDFAGRKGGDEFFVVLNNISLADIQSYTTIVERIQEAIAKINLEQAVKDANFYDLETDPQKRAKIEEDATKIKAEKLSITIGVTATANRSGLNAHQLFDESDQALYKAKHKQRGSVALAPVIAKLAAES